MLVRDAMTTNVVTVASNTPVLEARKIMEVHNVRRIPVVDKGKLVGMVTKNMTRRAAPSDATSLSVWEINYLMAKMTTGRFNSYKNLVSGHQTHDRYGIAFGVY